MRRPLHIIGDRLIPDAEILHVDWNAKGMLVATSLGNRVVRGENLIQLLPDLLWREPCEIQVGCRIEPAAPFIVSTVTDVRNSHDLPISTQTIPDLLLDLPRPFLGFQSQSRLTVGRWGDLMAAGWRGNNFWFALPDIAYVITPLAPIAVADRMPFLTDVVTARVSNHFAAGLTQAVIDRYGLNGRYPASSVTFIKLDELINDATAIRDLIVLSSRWTQTVAEIKARGISLGD